MHFAALAYVGESVADPGKYYRNNVSGSLNLLEAARDHGIRQFVFSSTCATYGMPDRLPIIEDTPQRPINPYGASKLMVERMLADFGAAHGLGSVALRYFNAAGADAQGEIGEAHDPETHLIPLVLDAASGGRANVTIYGADYDTPTAPASAITSTSAIWPKPTSRRSTRSARAARRTCSTLATAKASPCAKLSRRWSASPASTCL